MSNEFYLQVSYLSYALNSSIGAYSSADVDIHASVLRWVYAMGFKNPPPKADIPSTAYSTVASGSDDLGVVDSSVQVQVFSADVNANLPNKIEQELEHAIGKMPPENFPYKLIYVSAIYSARPLPHYFFTDRKGCI